MKTGTKSVLIGAHQFLLHPLFVAAAWTRLYGFPRDLRLWTAFFVHDLGYLGLTDMDSAEGERHVELGARLMAGFDREMSMEAYERVLVLYEDGEIIRPHAGGADAERWWARFGQPYTPLGTWGQLSLFHSRFYAKRCGHQPSRLCMADKLSAALEPWWLYLPRVIASGEVWEYVRNAARPSKYSGEPQRAPDAIDITDAELDARRLTRRTWRAIRAWHRRMTAYCRDWAFEHADGRTDTWTPAQERA